MEPRRREAGRNAGRQRTERFVERDDGWHFKTRENILVGPFPSVFDAQLAASLLITRLSQLERDEDSPQVIHSFISSACKPVARRVETPSVDLAEIRKNAKRDRLVDLANRVLAELTRPRNIASGRRS